VIRLVLSVPSLPIASIARCRIKPYLIKAAPLAPLARRQRRAQPLAGRPPHAGRSVRGRRSSQADSPQDRSKLAVLSVSQRSGPVTAGVLASVSRQITHSGNNLLQVVTDAGGLGTVRAWSLCRLPESKTRYSLRLGQIFLCSRLGPQPCHLATARPPRCHWEHR